MRLIETKCRPEVIRRISVRYSFTVSVLNLGSERIRFGIKMERGNGHKRKSKNDSGSIDRYSRDPESVLLSVNVLYTLSFSMLRYRTFH